MKRKVLCFVRGAGDDWEAICVDLDIAVQGRSFEEAKQLLRGSIDMYVTEAMHEAPAVRDRLLARKAPFSLRAKLLLSFLWRVLADRDNGDDMTAGFSMPCHA